MAVGVFTRNGRRWQQGFTLIELRAEMITIGHAFFLVAGGRIQPDVGGGFIGVAPRQSGLSINARISCP